MTMGGGRLGRRTSRSCLSSSRTSSTALSLAILPLVNIAQTLSPFYSSIIPHLAQKVNPYFFYYHTSHPSIIIIHWWFHSVIAGPLRCVRAPTFGPRGGFAGMLP